jgi:dTDP-4-dehydrorhamnose 3,5-epimerase
MKFISTKIEGVWVVEQERHSDRRGWFARTWCAEEFAAHGLNSALSQCSVSSNMRRGTIRGMHYQRAPHEETKLVRCLRGAFFDVALDLRPASPTFKQWVGVELTADNGTALYVPKGCAHGFQTLVEDTEVHYSIGGTWQPAFSRGVRWNDPDVAITWPLPITDLSQRDAELPLLAEVISAL